MHHNMIRRLAVAGVAASALAFGLLSGGTASASNTNTGTTTADAAPTVSVTTNCSVGDGVQMVVGGVTPASATATLTVGTGTNEPGSIVKGGTTTLDQEAGTDGKVTFQPSVPSGAGVWSLDVNGKYTGLGGAFTVKCSLGTPAVTKSGKTVKVVVKNTGNDANVEANSLTGGTKVNKTVLVKSGKTATIYLTVPTGKTAVVVRTQNRAGGTLHLVG